MLYSVDHARNPTSLSSFRSSSDFLGVSGRDDLLLALKGYFEFDISAINAEQYAIPLNKWKTLPVLGVRWCGATSCLLQSKLAFYFKTEINYYDDE